MTKYQPWGHIDWTLERMPEQKWSLLGALSTEDRCLATLAHRAQSLDVAHLLSIRDPEITDNVALKRKLEEREGQANAILGPSLSMPIVGLLDSLDKIRESVNSFFNTARPSVLLDISAMPKRWFFPIVRMLLENAETKNLVVTYTSAVKYAEHLAENPEQIRVLPGYFADNGRTEHKAFIVGIGFEPLGLYSLLHEVKPDKIQLIFPFPPGPPGYNRNWRFTREIDALTEGEIGALDRVHIHMYDCPQVFSALSRMTDAGQKTSALAPYGPKTMSLAMCLFSIAAAASSKPLVPVYYAQPRSYSMEYSVGIRRINGLPDIQAYCIKLAGRSLYELT
jgi:hypothetical protein